MENILKIRDYHKETSKLHERFNVLSSQKDDHHNVEFYIEMLKVAEAIELRESDLDTWFVMGLDIDDDVPVGITKVIIPDFKFK